MIEALLLSTSPASSPIRWTVSKSRSVGTEEAFFGHATHSRPGGVEAGRERREPGTQVPLLGHEQQDDVHRGAGASEALDARRQGTEGGVEALGRAVDVHLRALADPELLRQRSARVVLVRLRPSGSW